MVLKRRQAKGEPLKAQHKFPQEVLESPKKLEKSPSQGVKQGLKNMKVLMKSKK